MQMRCRRCGGTGRETAPGWAEDLWDALSEGFEGGWHHAVDVQRKVGGAHATVVKRLEGLERGGKVESRVRGGRREWRRQWERLASPHRASEPRALSQEEHRRAQAAGRVPHNADIQGLGKALGLRTADEVDDGLGEAPPEESFEEATVEPFAEDYGTGPGGRRGKR